MYIIIIAIAPVVALAIYFYKKDKYEKEPLSLLVRAFLNGFIVSFLAIIIEGILMVLIKPIKLFPLKIILKSFVVAGLTEEWCKFYVFRSLIYKNKNFNEPYDGIIYAVMIALGFAALENIGYVAAAHFKLGFLGTVNVGTFRALFAVPAHASWGVIMGYYFGLAKFANNKKIEQKYISKGLGLAILAHALYDFFIFTKTILGAIYMIAVFNFCWKFSSKAINIQVEKSPFKNQVDN